MKAHKVTEITLAAISIITLIFILTIPRQQKPKTGFSELEQFDEYLTIITEKNFPPAISVSVMQSGTMKYQKNFGAVTTENPLYAYWSITKPFTAVTILKLAEEGFISLNDAITDYLPQFQPQDKEKKPVTITIDNLLAHQSGLKDLDGDFIKWIHRIDEDYTGFSDLFYSRICAKYNTVKTPPGSETQYTNTSYIILAALIEAVTGKPYEEAVRAYCLDPLNLQNIWIAVPESSHYRLVQPTNPVLNIFTVLIKFFGTDDFNDRFIEKQENGRIYFYPLTSDYIGSTGLIGTVDDLAVFGNALLHQDRKLLSAESYSLLIGSWNKEELTTSSKNNNFARGLKTWILNDSVAHGHNGGGAGYGATMAIIPEQDLVIAILASDTNIDRDVLLEAAASINWSNQ